MWLLHRRKLVLAQKEPVRRGEACGAEDHQEQGGKAARCHLHSSKGVLVSGYWFLDGL